MAIGYLIDAYRYMRKAKKILSKCCEESDAIPLIEDAMNIVKDIIEQIREEYCARKTELIKEMLEEEEE